MPPTSQPVFGKRNAPGVGAAPRASDAAPIDQSTVFAAIRAELDDAVDAQAVVVPRSGRAAFLAGLVVGCALAGFNVTGSDGAARLAPIAGLLGIQIDTTTLLPAMILLGLVGGARAAAMTMILVHTILNKLGRTEHEAYALGGATATACLAGLLLGFGHAPAHGWPVELLAGAGSGLLYRIFAGARPQRRGRG